MPDYTIYVCPECGEQAGHFSATVCQHFDPDERYIDMVEVPVVRADALEAFVAHHEGERDCEKCKGSGKAPECVELGCSSPCRCSDCDGTGKVRADRLVHVSEVVEALRAHPSGHGYADYIEQLAREGKL